MARVSSSVLFRIAGLFWLAAAVFGQTPLNERVLVVYNSSGADSLAVAKYYMAQRKIPEAQRCKISVSSPDELTLEEYESRVKGPVRKCLEAAGRLKILYIVFSYQTPYDIKIAGQLFSLDQYVADIWDEYSPTRPGREVGNQPYFGDAQSQGNAYQTFVPLAAYREQPGTKNIYSVWRIDAANAGLAKGLVDKAMYAEAHGLSGKGCFDLQYGPIDRMGDYDSGAGDWDVHLAAELTKRAGFTVVEDEQTTEFGTAPSALRCEDAAFYAGWYSLGHYNDAFTWAPGALGFHLDSASASSPARRVELVGERDSQRHHSHQRRRGRAVSGRLGASRSNFSVPVPRRLRGRCGGAQHALAEVDDHQHRRSALPAVPARRGTFSISTASGERTSPGAADAGGRRRVGGRGQPEQPGPRGRRDGIAQERTAGFRHAAARP